MPVEEGVEKWTGDSGREAVGFGYLGKKGRQVITGEVICKMVRPSVYIGWV